MDDFSILYGLETAQLENKQTIRLKHISCESYGFDIQLILNSTDIEKITNFVKAVSFKSYVESLFICNKMIVRFI